MPNASINVSGIQHEVCFRFDQPYTSGSTYYDDYRRVIKEVCREALAWVDSIDPCMVQSQDG